MISSRLKSVLVGHIIDGVNMSVGGSVRVRPTGDDRCFTAHHVLHLSRLAMADLVVSFIFETVRSFAIVVVAIAQDGSGSC